MTTGFYLAGIIGTIGSFLAGCLWYTVLTGKLWQHEMGFSDEQIKKIFTPKRMLAAFASEWIAAFCTIGLFYNLQVSLVYKIIMLAAVITFHGVKLGIFDGKSMKVIVINEGYRLVSIIILGVSFMIFM